MNFDFERDFVHGIENDLNEFVADLRANAGDVLEEVSEDAKVEIRVSMPVDTGAARQSWGELVYSVDRDALSVEQGGLWYIGRLEDGYSDQAPPGFIGAIADDLMDEFSGRLDQRMGF